MIITRIRINFDPSFTLIKARILNVKTDKLSAFKCPFSGIKACLWNCKNNSVVKHGEKKYVYCENKEIGYLSGRHIKYMNCRTGQNQLNETLRTTTGNKGQADITEQPK